ncbi:MAG TPA: PASTA domain-containing protein [Thermoanaerobaculia bacterium]|nr:PASTA domain-containing protein [Thermoanaerobaculia bacterium]
MKSGCLGNFFFASLVFLAFGFSTYVWFSFFVRGKSVSVPNLVGKSVTEAKAICSDLGVNLSIDPEHRRNSDRVAADNIVWQNRAPGATNLIKRGTTIKVELSSGPLILRVPDFGGERAGTAVLRLGQQNLKPGSMTYIESPQQQGVLAADPPKGTVVGAQTPVSLLVGVASAPTTFVMPDLIDHPLDHVRPYLEAHGLIVSNVKFEAYPGIRDGIIIRQFPLRGAPVSARDPITVVVSRQEETAIVEQPPG